MCSVQLKPTPQSFWEIVWKKKNSLKDGLVWSEAGSRMMPGFPAHYPGRKLNICIRTRFYHCSEVLAIDKKKGGGTTHDCQIKAELNIVLASHWKGKSTEIIFINFLKRLEVLLRMFLCYWHNLLNSSWWGKSVSWLLRSHLLILLRPLLGSFCSGNFNHS